MVGGRYITLLTKIKIYALYRNIENMCNRCRERKSNKHCNCHNDDDGGCQDQVGNVSNIQVSNLSPFPCIPTSTQNPPEGTGVVFPNSEAEPDIAVGFNPINPDVPMVVACWQQDRYNRNGGCNADYMRISLDGGATFGDFIPLPNVQCFGGPYERTSDPHVKITNKGEIYFTGTPFSPKGDGTFNGNGITVAKYNVVSNSFVYVKDIDPQAGGLTGPNDTGLDYDFIVIDPQDCTGDTAYMGWTRYYFVDPVLGTTISQMTFSKTTDGVNWATPKVYMDTPALDFSLGPVSDTALGINRLALLENPGKSYSKIIACTNDSVGFDSVQVNQWNLMYSTYSLDQGVTWSTPVLFDIRFNGGSSNTATQIIDPDTLNAPKVIQIRGGDGNPYVVSDRKRNRLYVVANLDSLLNTSTASPAGPAPSGVYLFVSLDGAMSWRSVGKINRNQSIQAFNPAITVLENGHVAVSYFDFRNHVANPDTTLPLETDRWLDIFHYNEDENTVTLMSETRLTPTSFNFRNAVPLIGGNFLPGGYFVGDYMGMEYYKGKIYNNYGVANSPNNPNNFTDIYQSIVTLL